MHVEIILIGGGLAGTVAGIAFAQAGFKVVVIDQRNPINTLSGTFDGRTTALSLGSKHMFESLEMWRELKGEAQPIWDIRVHEYGSPWSLTYDHLAVGTEPLGYIISNTELRNGLFRAFQQEKTKNLTLLAPAQAKTVERSPKGVRVLLEDGRELNALCLIAAEGQHSPTREEEGIKVTRWDYHQRALTCTVTHDESHEGRAWEVFAPGGPLAALPLLPCVLTGLHRSGIVWADHPIQIDHLLKLTDEELALHFEEAFPFLGKISESTLRFDYPLRGHKVDRLIGERLALIGDSAHLIHPVAGQGVNLGWRDAIALCNSFSAGRRQGLDIGSSLVLEGYQKGRLADQRMTMSLCHGMVKLFSNKSSVLHFLRNAGFGIINELPFLKRQLIRQASK